MSKDNDFITHQKSTIMNQVTEFCTSTSTLIVTTPNDFAMFSLEIHDKLAIARTPGKKMSRLCRHNRGSNETKVVIA